MLQDIFFGIGRAIIEYSSIEALMDLIKVSLLALERIVAF